MRVDQKTVRRLYSKLITLYPRAFREQFGESMGQTFNDLYNEQKRRTKPNLFGFVLWTFGETAIGICSERYLQFKQPMIKTITTNLRSPALIGLLLVLPFMILEALLNHATARKVLDLFLLFGLLWLLPTGFMVILLPVVQNVRAGNRMMAKPIQLLLRVALIALVAMLWGVILLDQLLCFLGLPNCD